jgi:hypothetical protein
VTDHILTLNAGSSSLKFALFDTAALTCAAIGGAIPDCVVLALGTRLNPFSTLPGYGIDYWPKTA